MNDGVLCCGQVTECKVLRIFVGQYVFLYSLLDFEVYYSTKTCIPALVLDYGSYSTYLEKACMPFRIATAPLLNEIDGVD